MCHYALVVLTLAVARSDVYACILPVHECVCMHVHTRKCECECVSDCVDKCVCMHILCLRVFRFSFDMNVFVLWNVFFSCVGAYVRL